MVMLTVLKVYHFSMGIKYRFIVLNKRLIRCQKDFLYPTSFFRRNHLILCECINFLSEIFGAQILFVTILIILSIVKAFDVVIKSGNLQVEDPFQFVAVSIWNTGMFIVFAIMISASCEQTIQEKGRTQKICHRLLTNLPPILSKNQEFFQQEFRLLAKQIDQIEVKFTAVGFFDIDNTLLLTIFGSIASYVIILLQFKEIKRDLKQLIENSKKKSWRRLCEELNEDIWGKTISEPSFF
ncbi:putative gustatory receptor 28a [Onthophagus taurus]|uniref:putative gustatory receptor 28a n=1 Tax=Onthophagus taurus TaxID=166361 RepID=UPI0039BDB8C2